MPGTITRPFTGADNYLDTAILNRDHSVTAPQGSGVLAGDLRALWDGRRGARSTVTIDRDGTTNDAELNVDLASAKTVNFLWLDRGHNMTGETVVVQWSDSGTTGPWTTALGATVIGTDGTSLDDGSWAVDIPASSHQYWRIVFQAASADPLLSMVFLGQMFYLGEFMVDVARDDSRTVDYPGQARSRRGVVSFGEAPVEARFMRGRYRTAENEWNNTLAKWVDAWFGKGMPVLWVTDWVNQPARMRLFRNNASEIDPAFSVRGFREFDIDLIELL